MLARPIFMLMLTLCVGFGSFRLSDAKQFPCNFYKELAESNFANAERERRETVDNDYHNSRASSYQNAANKYNQEYVECSNEQGAVPPLGMSVLRQGTFSPPPRVIQRQGVPNAGVPLNRKPIVEVQTPNEVVDTDREEREAALRQRELDDSAATAQLWVDGISGALDIFNQYLQNRR